MVILFVVVYIYIYIYLFIYLFIYTYTYWSRFRFRDADHLKTRWTEVKDKAWADDMAAARGVPVTDESKYGETVEVWDADLHADLYVGEPP